MGDSRDHSKHDWDITSHMDYLNHSKYSIVNLPRCKTFSNYIQHQCVIALFNYFYTYLFKICSTQE